MADDDKEKFDYDRDKVDEVALALLYLSTYKGELGLRAWKNIDFGVLTRLHENGFISNPITKSKSVAISEQAAKKSEELFRKYFEIRKDEAKEEPS